MGERDNMKIEAIDAKQLKKYLDDCIRYWRRKVKEDEESCRSK